MSCAVMWLYQRLDSPSVCTSDVLAIWHTRTNPDGLLHWWTVHTFLPSLSVPVIEVYTRACCVRTPGLVSLANLFISLWAISI